ncbi:monovalent cation/H(+) antiporter subunit G [Pannonibacter phragmitetus]|uniref:monovalent cation/H(+) antiporter subunit G n=1 Tax=Pannonibacter phragmitetus TaxID=121719 RepID=UPI003D2EE7F0
MLMLLSVLLKLAGVGFLCIAALGVMKLPDPFQRMHAATKAGTLGAGLVLLGSIIAHGEMDAVVLGLFTLLFLLLTVPVAGHLLGRAAYVSGARLALAGGDALDGVLRRAPQPLDERTKWPTGWSAGEPEPGPSKHREQAPFRHLVEPRGP